MYSTTHAPGVYFQKDFGLPQRRPFLTGVPVFLGQITTPSPKVKAEKAPVPHMLSLWSQFGHIGTHSQHCHVAYAVRGFFENGGARCYVVALKDSTIESLEAGLHAIEGLNTIDLVCVPGLATKTTDKKKDRNYQLQQIVVDHCES